MKCEHHPNRDAKHYCTSCGSPICSECAEEVSPGVFSCFQCAMFQTISGVGSSLKDRKERVVEKKLEKKKKWGPFQYFIISCSSLIIVMWGVILFGGQKAPGKSKDYLNNPRIFLFMIDSSIKRYAYYEGNQYPETLTSLIPKYLNMDENDRYHLSRFSYKKDRELGYRLSFVNPPSNELEMIITSNKILFPSSTGGGE